MPATPEVRQCVDERSPRLFGAVAVRLPEGSLLGEWGVMTTNNGGHFASTAEVESWPPLIRAADDNG